MREKKFHHWEGIIITLNENKYDPEKRPNPATHTHSPGRNRSMVNTSLPAKCQQAPVEVDITGLVQRH